MDLVVVLELECRTDGSNTQMHQFKNHLAGTGIGYADTLFPKKHQYGDTDTIFLIKIKT
jgi:hypothetical protein